MSKTFYQETDDILERFELATERIATIKEDHDLPEKLQAYFNQVADFILTVLPIMNKAADGTLGERTITECENDNDAVFAIYGEDTYPNSFLCPTFAVAELGQELGGPLSAIFYEMTNIIEAARTPVKPLTILSRMMPAMMRKPHTSRMYSALA